MLKEETAVEHKDKRIQYNINILIFPNFVITLHNKPISSITHVIYNIIEYRKYYTPGWVMFSFLDVLADASLERIKAIENESKNNLYLYFNLFLTFFIFKYFLYFRIYFYFILKKFFKK